MNRKAVLSHTNIESGFCGWVFLFGALLMIQLPLSGAEPAREYSTADETLAIRHEPSQEGLYFTAPAGEVAYNVQILRLKEGGYSTVYHGEPKKEPGKPGDSIKTAVDSAPFGKMPAARRFIVHGDPNDSLSPLYSPPDGWGGGGNPMVIKGIDPDPYYYIFFLAVVDDHGDWNGKAFRHLLCQGRTKNFLNFELLAEVEGRPQYKPYGPDSPAAWKRPWLLRDNSGERVQSRRATGLDSTQGLIGSICFHDNRYYFFYADCDPDGKTYFYYRTAADLITIRDGRTLWSPPERISGPLMTGLIIRVALARDRSRWAVLYNGCRKDAAGIHGDLCLQYTRDLSVTDPGGLAGVRWFDEGEAAGISRAFLQLGSGCRCYAQHCFLTDPWGALTVTAEDDGNPQIGGLLTWADLPPGVYGGRVLWAKWQTIRRPVDKR